jgi:hypothetical protein
MMPACVETQCSWGKETFCTKATEFYFISVENFSKILLLAGMKLCQVGWAGVQIIQLLKSCNHEGQNKLEIRQLRSCSTVLPFNYRL